MEVFRPISTHYSRFNRYGPLAASAALLVVEDFPAPPFKRWTERLSDSVTCPVIAVDCACIVPMTLQPKRFERAFEFRQHNYFTARDPAFQRAVEAWSERGLVASWQARIGRVGCSAISSSPDETPRYVATPRMSALGAHLGADLDIRRRVRVAPPMREVGQWALRCEDGDDLGLFDILVVSAPAPQAADLLSAIAPKIAATAAAVSYAATWAVMLEADGPDDLKYDGLFFDDGILAWAARNGSKPGRRGSTWVLHADPDWSASNLDAGADAVGAALSDRFCAATTMSPARVRVASVYRWRYSLVPAPLSVGALWDDELRLGVCGDWCNGARIEDAFLSGHAVAGRILGDLAHRALIRGPSQPD